MRTAQTKGLTMCTMEEVHYGRDAPEARLVQWHLYPEDGSGNVIVSGLSYCELNSEPVLF